MQQPIKFGVITDCEPGELVRLNIEGGPEWAIVGQRGNAYLPVGVLPFRTSAYHRNLSNQMGDPLPEFDEPLVRYGKDYSFVPSHSGQCVINHGFWFTAPGALVISDGGTFLTFTMSGMNRIAYLHLETGRFGSEPGGARIAFGDWALVHHSLEEKPVVLRRSISE